MRVLCVGDSLGLPRKGCPYEKTWFFKLAKKCKHSKKGSIIKSLPSLQIKK